jgi:gag-polyprotein putative aspartyl protease
MRKKGPYRRELLKKRIDGVKGTEETNPIDSKEPEPEAPCPERANRKRDQHVLNKKKKVTFSDMVKIIPRRSLSKSPLTHDLDQVPSVETAYVDLNMTIKTSFVQHNKKKVVSNNDTTALQLYVSILEQGERGDDESLSKTGSVIRLCTLGYTHTRKRLPMLKIQVSINGHDMVALVDCGCEATTISHPCADKLGVKRNPVGNQAEHWDGTLTSLEAVDTPITMELGDNVRHEIQPYISHVVTYDLILGMDWLYRYNPHIKTKRQDYLVSARLIARLAKKKLRIFYMCVKRTMRYRKTLTSVPTTNPKAIL